jgi:drug/metabolite transporter (DMT)-like permease
MILTSTTAETSAPQSHAAIDTSPDVTDVVSGAAGVISETADTLSGVVGVVPDPAAGALTGALAALGATLLWSGNFVIASGLGPQVPPVQLAFYRWLVAVLTFTPFVLRSAWAHRGALKRHAGYLALTALIGVTIFNTLVYTAGRTTTALNLSLISISSPLFMILLSRVVFGERVTLTQTLGTAIVLGGLIFLITGGAPARVLHLTFAVGDLWMLLAALLFAVYSILVRRKPAEMPVLIFQYATFALGLLMLLPIYLGSLVAQPTVIWDPVSLLSLGYVGVFASLVAFTLWSRAIALIGPARAGMIYYLSPVSSGLLGALILGQPIGWVQIASMAAIILGLLIATGTLSFSHRPLRSGA